MRTPELRHVDVGGHRLAVETDGDGPPLVLLHGFTGSARTWDAIRPALAGRYRTLAVELLGHGRSDAPREAAPYAFGACLQGLLRVLDACAAPRAHVLGYSMGGRVALALAASAPDRVASLVTVGASAGLADPQARAARRAADDALAADLERDGIEPFVERWTALPLFASQRRLGDAFLARARRERLRCAPHALAHTLRGLGLGIQPPLHARLPGLHVPTLLVAGALDAKFSAIARELAAALPDARAAIVPAAGHAVQLEAPDALAALVLDFLASRPPGPHASPASLSQGEPIREHP